MGKRRSSLFSAGLAAAFIALAAAESWAAPVPRGAPFADEINGFADDDRKDPPPACAFLFVGASSIGGWDTLARDMAPRTVIRRGFGGSHIRNVNAYFDRIVAPYKPRAIVFYAGENDVESGRELVDLAGDFETFMAKKTASLGATPVYFISVKPSKARWAQRADQARFNDMIRAMAAKRGDLRFVDVVPAMLENGAPKALFVADGLHLNAAGYAIWTKIVGDALNAPAPSKAPGC